jgi:hypothetical protein
MYIKVCGGKEVLYLDVVNICFEVSFILSICGVQLGITSITYYL